MTSARSALPPELAAALASNPDLARVNPGLTGVYLDEFSGVTKEQWEILADKPKRGKYGNVRTEYKGHVYDSKREAAHAGDLDLQKAAGEVIAWFAHVVFPLAPGISYEADFVVILADWSVVVKDAKGARTKEYRIKKKLFEARYGREIVEV